MTFRTIFKVPVPGLSSLSLVLRCGVAFCMAICFLASLAMAQGESEKAEQKKIKVLIVDGQNNHGDWPKITAMMKSYLIESGRFEVDVARTQYLWQGQKWIKDYSLDDGKTYKMLDRPQADPDFKPNFSDYQVVISNFGFNAAPWPESTQKAFTKFMNDGGGLVTVHAADNSFPQWREYNEMIGLGGWGGRNESSGPYVYLNDKGDVVKDNSKGGGGGHGPQHEFPLIVRDQEHPIMKGLPKEFLHAKDELYERLRGPALNMNILATAYAAPKFKGSGRHEPTLMTIEFGKGRVFHSTLGHADYSMECVAAITLLLRGTEWAATGEVTLGVPEDFPSADKSRSRKFEK